VHQLVEHLGIAGEYLALILGVNRTSAPSPMGAARPRAVVPLTLGDPRVADPPRWRIGPEERRSLLDIAVPRGEPVIHANRRRVCPCPVIDILAGGDDLGESHIPLAGEHECAEKREDRSVHHGGTIHPIRRGAPAWTEMFIPVARP
jgi:hypothetical protein